MKAVLQSIKPQYCELIATGEKTIEVRKTKPKLETPFKCYIYCTKDRNNSLWVLRENLRDYVAGKATAIFKTKDCGGATKANGKVIGEFVCYDITKYTTEFHSSDKLFQGIWEQIIDEESGDEYGNIVTGNDFDNPDNCDICKRSCLSFKEIRNYIGYGDREFYAWHISNLVIYDEPKELSEFRKPLSVVEKTIDNNGYWLCDGCPDAKWEDGHLVKCSDHCCSHKTITRPPQSWCYVEEA